MLKGIKLSYVKEYLGLEKYEAKSRRREQQRLG